MRRIPNRPHDEWTDDAREAFSYWGEPGSWENGSSNNLTMALANHPALSRAFNPWAKHLLLGSTVPPRLREIATLRMCWRLRIPYEWHFHVELALGEGLTIEEISAVRDGPAAPFWSHRNEDRLALQAADDLIRDARISDVVWAALCGFLSRRQLMDLTFACGHYLMMNCVLRTFGVPFEDGVDPVGFDLKTASGKAPGSTLRPDAREDWGTVGEHG
jgi:alkylhydroperoxidase family enzyme